ncbi:glycosyltransferase involved in cell wall biosynthesis [Novosphingobium chloroacetimidivorans]|uniref:Glycosyltransferase involved in cell wall biosynthesis n=1 Tax=Novosphingobium chloroacetimidivorans TaxID=1428314 RepID=A0A7W7K739_9SPHN|nr:glycosyltransferase involved in cell wall biosynthesis [Novosphingobium chloroacetimidivorans]
MGTAHPPLDQAAGHQTDVSVVIPCRNEEANAEAIAAAVIAELEPLDVTFDIIFIDNESVDRTVEIIRAMCARDPRIRLIINTRNFGQMRSPTHGIFEARGRAVIGMCADFQDPPALLPRFIERWRAGIDIVLGVRESEKSGFILDTTRKLSYTLARSFGDHAIIPNATGFGLYDRKVVDAIKAMNEPEPFFRGMLVETGYPLETITYHRPVRARGKSNNNFFALLDFAVGGLTASSKRLLRVPLYLGVLGAVATLVMGIGGVIAFFAHRPIAGWFIAMVLQAQFALLFGFLGLMGDHIRLISERTRRTPLVLERERVNFPQDY